MKIRIAVGDNWSSSLNLSGLYFNRLDNRYIGDCMVSSESIWVVTICQIVGIMKIRIAVGDNWSSSLNLSGLYFNRLDNRYVGNRMVSSESRGIWVVTICQIVGISVSLSICTDSSKEGNHQQELHVVTAL